MNDLTEKLKELLMSCDCGTSISFTYFDAGDECYTVGEPLAIRLAKQLAPEIEKMIERETAPLRDKVGNHVGTLNSILKMNEIDKIHRWCRDSLTGYVATHEQTMVELSDKLNAANAVIEKLMPRLIPVSERLPDEGQWIYVWEECANALVHYRGQKYLFFTFTHWMPIPKGPTG